MKKVKTITRVGDVAYVPLTRGYEAIIDADDIGLIESLNWQAMIGRNAIYAVAMTRDRKTVLMHRLILQVPPGLVCDHIDRNGINNRRSNLRLATVAENGWNRPASKNNRSGYKGVHWHTQQNRWRVRIRRNREDVYLGSYASLEDAHAAYVKAARQLHGEFWRE